MVVPDFLNKYLANHKNNGRGLCDILWTVKGKGDV